MFIEKIDPQLLEEIREALYEEQNELQANWDGVLIDLKNEDFEDLLRSQIFSDYLNIPLHMLSEMISQHFPFIKEKDIFPDPYSDVIISENGESKVVCLRVYADHFGLDRSMLSEIELKQLDKLFEELTQLYEDLEVDTTLYIAPVPLEEVPNDYLDEEDEQEFVRLEF
ncbi:hypothetical protein SAMN05880501_11759 [Ureibacillus xyleni]|uniref:Uncharacterized protein n=1 Tax=Ureibacillus xyleni TaxID=614648 RepID=A0A285TPE4_9BACL|nr:hypothetical protein [Ureibacillus xyleni]SOC24574.1 hypothetical protein SAMN05880501_11759 [Ureibacillus xyleni]